MTREEAVKQIRWLQQQIDGHDPTFRGDEEDQHRKADQILCELLTSLGCEDVVEAFNDLSKWYA